MSSNKSNKVLLPRYQKSNPRVGDRVCTTIELPTGRWVPGTKIDTPFFYQSPPVDVVADRLAKRNGQHWSNPRVNVGTVIATSKNRRELSVKLDANREQPERVVKMHAKEVIDAGNVERALANSQVQVLLETIKKEDAIFEKRVQQELLQSATTNSSSSIPRTLTQHDMQRLYGNTLPLASMYEEDERARRRAEEVLLARLAAEHKRKQEEEKRKYEEAVRSITAEPSAAAPPARTYTYATSLPMACDAVPVLGPTSAAPAPHTAAPAAVATASADVEADEGVSEVLLRRADGSEVLVSLPFVVTDAKTVSATTVPTSVASAESSTDCADAGVVDNTALSVSAPASFDDDVIVNAPARGHKPVLRNATVAAGRLSTTSTRAPVLARPATATTTRVRTPAVHVRLDSAALPADPLPPMPAHTRTATPLVAGRRTPLHSTAVTATIYSPTGSTAARIPVTITPIPTATNTKTTPPAPAPLVPTYGSAFSAAVAHNNGARQGLVVKRGKTPVAQRAMGDSVDSFLLSTKRMEETQVHTKTSRTQRATTPLGNPIDMRVVRGM